MNLSLNSQAASVPQIEIVYASERAVPIKDFQLQKPHNAGMSRIFLFENIILQPPVSKIYRRLGYRKDETRLTSTERASIDAYIEEALSFIRLRGTARRLAIAARNSKTTTLEGNIVLNSTRLATFLKSAEEILLMGATSGAKIIEAIEDDSIKNNLTRGIILDAVASEMTDGALDWISTCINRTLRRENRVLTKRRFSAGYGDFALENQRILYDLLDLDRLDIQITRSCVLLPEKSVTAVAGIERGA